MQRRFLPSALLAAALLSATACADQLPTLSGDEEFPDGTIPVTREVILPASEFFEFLGSFAGYTAVAAAPYQVVATDYEGLDARALNAFTGFPAFVTYERDGTEQRDSAFTYQTSQLVLRVDSAASRQAPVTLRVYAAAQAWDRPTATWEVAVDTGAAPVPWTEPGGTLGALLGEATWGGPSGADSVVVHLTGDVVQSLADSTSHGVIITAAGAGSRVQLSDVVLRAVTRPDAADVDTTIVVNVNTSATRTTIYTPDQPDPPAGVLAVGGVRGARSLVRIDPRVTVPSCPSGNACQPVPLSEVRLNQVAVLFDVLDTPSGYDPLGPTPVSLRVVQEPELGRFAPLGPSVADRDAMFRAGDSVLQLEITALAATMAGTDSVFPTSFALVSESALTGGPPSFGAGFLGNDPMIRIVYTIPTRRRLP